MSYNWGLNPIWVPKLQKNPFKCQEGWGYNLESLVSIHCSDHIYPHFGTKTSRILKLSDLVPVWFRNLKSRYCRVVVQLLFQRFVRFYHRQLILRVQKPTFLHFSLGLSTYLVSKFKIMILPHWRLDTTVGSPVSCTRKRYRVFYHMEYRRSLPEIID